MHYRNLWDPALVLKDVLGAISRAKDELVDAHGYRALAEKMLAGATGPGKAPRRRGSALKWRQIYERYEQAKQDHGAVDFGDLIMRPALLLERNPRCGRPCGCATGMCWSTNIRT